MLEVLSTATAGLRSALVLFAVMALIAVAHGPRAATALDRWRRRAGALFAVAAVGYSPAHAAWLLGWPFPPIVSRSLDGAATLVACISLIHLLAGWALERGIAERRVRRGIMVNVAVLLAVVGAAWFVR